jgi:hypothetical protein
VRRSAIRYRSRVSGSGQGILAPPRGTCYKRLLDYAEAIKLEAEMAYANEDLAILREVVSDPKFNAVRLCMMGSAGLPSIPDPLYGFSPDLTNGEESREHAELGRPLG